MPSDEGFDLDAAQDPYASTPIPASHVHTAPPDAPDDPGDCPADGCSPDAEYRDRDHWGWLYVTEYQCGHVLVER